MEHTAYNIDTQITMLPSLLKFFEMFKMCLWYDDENFEENGVDNIVIRCSNCGKTASLSVKIPITKTWSLNLC